MESLVRMVTSKKADCAIYVTVNSAEATFKSAYELSVILERCDKIIGESNTFHLGPDKSHVEIGHTFNTKGKYSFDKKSNKWSGKECAINLGYYSNGQRINVGTAKFNVAAMVDKEEQVKTMTFTNFLSSSESMKLSLTFRVTSAIGLLDDA